MGARHQDGPLVTQTLKRDTHCSGWEGVSSPLDGPRPRALTLRTDGLGSSHIADTPALLRACGTTGAKSLGFQHSFATKSPALLGL